MIHTMNIKYLSIVIVLVVSATWMTGCVPRESSQPSDDTPPVTTSPTTETTQPSLPSDDPAGPEEAESDELLAEVPRISVEELKRKIDAGANILIVDSIVLTGLIGSSNKKPLAMLQQWLQKSKLVLPSYLLTISGQL